MFNIEEARFLSVLKQILEQPTRSDRTRIGTKSLFAPQQMRFSLENNRFPLLTTRKLPMRHIFEELMWFLRGQTDVSILSNKKINIWNPNSTREFLDNRGLHHYDVGDIGPGYGFQFRHSGATYVDCKTNYKGQGIDQLENVLYLLKNDPTSRRILINLWNPKDLSHMALTPCGYSYEFYVSGNNMNELSCKVIQRSSDISLAGGWNIASGSLLTILIAHVCHMIPKEFIWSIGDAHIYLNQFKSVEEQLKRTPYHFPTLHIKSNKSIADFTYSDLQLNEYRYHPSIKLTMNA